MAHTVHNTIAKQNLASVGSSSDAAERTIPLGFTPTIGRKLKLVVTIASYDSGDARLAGIVHGSNTWSLVTGSRLQFGSGNRSAVEVWETDVVSGGTGTSVVLTLPHASGMFITVAGVEASGLSGVVDEVKTATASSATALTVTADNANDQNDNLVMAGAMRDGFTANATFSAPATGYTGIATEQDGNSFATHQSARKSITAGETSSAAWSGVASGDLGGTLVVFKDAAAGPSVTDVDTDETITPGQANIAITGSGFGASQGAGNVKLIQGSVTKTYSTVDSWAATAIQFDETKFESEATDLKYGGATLRVTDNGGATGDLPIIIAPPSGKNYVTLTSLAGAGERITAVADLAIGDQLEWSNVQGPGMGIGDVTINPDGTFECDEDVTSFDVRAWDAADQSWGAIGTQIPGLVTASGAGVTVTVTPPTGTATNVEAGSGIDTIIRLRRRVR